MTCYNLDVTLSGTVDDLWIISFVFPLLDATLLHLDSFTVPRQFHMREESTGQLWKNLYIFRSQLQLRLNDNTFAGQDSDQLLLLRDTLESLTCVSLCPRCAGTRAQSFYCVVNRSANDCRHFDENRESQIDFTWFQRTSSPRSRVKHKCSTLDVVYYDRDCIKYQSKHSSIRKLHVIMLRNEIKNEYDIWNRNQ